MCPLFGGFPIENRKVIKMSPFIKEKKPSAIGTWEVFVSGDLTVQYLQYVL